MAFSGCEWDAQFFRHSKPSLGGGANWHHLTGPAPHLGCSQQSPTLVIPTERDGRSQTCSTLPKSRGSWPGTAPALPKLLEGLAGPSWELWHCWGWFPVTAGRNTWIGAELPSPRESHGPGSRNKPPMASLWHACLLLWGTWCVQRAAKASLLPPWAVLGPCLLYRAQKSHQRPAWSTGQIQLLYRCEGQRAFWFCLSLKQSSSSTSSASQALSQPVPTSGDRTNVLPILQGWKPICQRWVWGSAHGIIFHALCG